MPIHRIHIDAATPLLPSKCTQSSVRLRNYWYKYVVAVIILYLLCNHTNVILNLFLLPLHSIQPIAYHLYTLTQQSTYHYGEQYARQRKHKSQLPITNELLTQWWNDKLVESIETIAVVQQSYTDLLSDGNDDLCTRYKPLYYDMELQQYWSVHQHSHKPYIVDELTTHDCTIQPPSTHSTDSNWYNDVCASNCNFAHEQANIDTDMRYVTDAVLQRILLECYACERYHTVIGADASVYIGKRSDDEYTYDKHIDKATAHTYDTITSHILFNTTDTAPIHMFYLDALFNHFQVNRLVYAYNYANTLLNTLFTDDSATTTLYNTFVNEQELMSTEQPYNIINDYIQDSLNNVEQYTLKPTYISGGGGSGIGYQVICEHAATKHRNKTQFVLLSSGGGQGGGYRILSSMSDTNKQYDNNQQHATELLYMSSGVGSGAGLQYWSDGHIESDSDRKQYKQYSHNNSTDWLNNVVHNADKRTDKHITLNVGGGGGSGYISRYSNNGDSAVSQQYGQMSDIDQIIPDTDTRTMLFNSIQQCIKDGGAVKLVGGGGAGVGGSVKISQHKLDHSTSNLAELADTISNADLNHRLEALMKQWWNSAIDTYDTVSWFAQASYRFEVELNDKYSNDAMVKPYPKHQHSHTHNHEKRTNTLIETTALHNKPDVVQRDSDSTDLQGTQMAREIEQCTIIQNDSLDWYTNIFCPCVNNVFKRHNYEPVLDCT